MSGKRRAEEGGEDGDGGGNGNGGTSVGTLPQKRLRGATQCSAEGKGLLNTKWRELLGAVAEGVDTLNSNYADVLNEFKDKKKIEEVLSTLLQRNNSEDEEGEIDESNDRGDTADLNRNECKAKVVVIGPPNTGKTSFVNYFLKTMLLDKDRYSEAVAQWRARLQGSLGDSKCEVFVELEEHPGEALFFAKDKLWRRLGAKGEFTSYLTGSESLWLEELRNEVNKKVHELQHAKEDPDLPFLLEEHTLGESIPFSEIGIESTNGPFVLELDYWSPSVVISKLKAFNRCNVNEDYTEEVQFMINAFGAEENTPKASVDKSLPFEFFDRLGYTLRFTVATGNIETDRFCARWLIETFVLSTHRNVLIRSATIHVPVCRRALPSNCILSDITGIDFASPILVSRLKSALQYACAAILFVRSENTPEVIINQLKESDAKQNIIAVLPVDKPIAKRRDLKSPLQVYEEKLSRIKLIEFKQYEKYRICTQRIITTKRMWYDNGELEYEESGIASLFQSIIELLNTTLNSKITKTVSLLSDYLFYFRKSVKYFQLCLQSQFKSPLKLDQTSKIKNDLQKALYDKFNEKKLVYCACFEEEQEKLCQSLLKTQREIFEVLGQEKFSGVFKSIDLSIDITQIAIPFLAWDLEWLQKFVSHRLVPKLENALNDTLKNVHLEFAKDEIVDKSFDKSFPTASALKDALFAHPDYIEIRQKLLNDFQQTELTKRSKLLKFYAESVANIAIKIIGLEIESTIEKLIRDFKIRVHDFVDNAATSINSHNNVIKKLIDHNASRLGGGDESITVHQFDKTLEFLHYLTTLLKQLTSLTPLPVVEIDYQKIDGYYHTLNNPV